MLGASNLSRWVFPYSFMVGYSLLVFCPRAHHCVHVYPALASLLHPGEERWGTKVMAVAINWRLACADSQDKWELLPAFLKVKGLVKQHLDSYNYFVNHDIKNILKVNEYVQSDVDPSSYIRYTDIWVRKPSRGGGTTVTPMECRLTDSNYSGAIMVKIQYTFEKAVKTFHKSLCIGHLPVMLRSDLCHLKGQGEKELARMGECPLDPGGYFVVKGTEKVILVQEQLSKNRIIVMTDPKKDLVQAEVTS